ncbi:MAG: protein translocase subunit SecD [Methylacidiphilales bacterium]|nr:protein translocase subunit SecD [Candidatus Methylacidiphilales bacterium]MDW8349719.1 protein translocase subunit SecD [Verrucomicrobiae bacterium]
MHTALLFLTAIGFLVFLIWYLATDEMETRLRVGLACILSIAACCGLSLFPIDKNIRLGLDLKGGTAFLIGLDGTPSEAALNQAVEVIRKRVDNFGLTEPIIQPVGTNRISVQIPGLSEENKAAARQQLSRVAKLEFRLVHPENEELIREFKENGTRPPLDYEILDFVERDRQGNEVREKIVVKRKPDLTGKAVAQAYRTFDEIGRANVAIEFTEEGKAAFGKLTSENIGNRLAIVLDGEVRSAPVINQAIFGQAVISGGGMTPQEAEEVASVLENPLETPVKILEERAIDATLGTDSIEGGIRAGIIASVSVVGFMVLYYHLLGIISVIALAINIFLLLGFLAQFQFTLTLPGIAGIILTIGMAVDANVLIYERIRDELKRGTPIPIAYRAGFERAFNAIFDSNVTTLIPAVILIFLGTGPLQGFAVTLTLGLIANLFSALIVTRNAMEWLITKFQPKHLTMFQIIDNPKLNFLSLRLFSAGFLAVVFLATFIIYQQKGSSVYGVDFLGGDAVTIRYQQPIPIQDIRKTLQDKKEVTGNISTFPEENLFIIQTRYENGDAVFQILQNQFPEAGLQKVALDRVGPVVGSELRDRAILSISFGLIGILIFAMIRYNWTFAFAATIGQIVDVTLTFLIIASLGVEINMPLIAAFLTIAGYSINDKIVIFDRIREGLKLRQNESLIDIINESLNFTLARTLITGGTLVLAILALLFFGGSIIHNFALTMLVGVLTGMFTSHLFAPALIYWLRPSKRIPIPSNPTPSPISS